MKGMKESGDSVREGQDLKNLTVPKLQEILEAWLLNSPVDPMRPKVAPKVRADLETALTEQDPSKAQEAYDRARYDMILYGVLAEAQLKKLERGE